MAHPTRYIAALATLFSTPALGASPTDIAPMLGGSVEINYEGQVFTSLLREQGIEVGSITRSAQVARFNAALGVAPGVELQLGLPYQVGGGIRYGDNIATMQSCTTLSESPPLSDGCAAGLVEGSTVIIGSDYNGNPIWVPTDYLAPEDIPEYFMKGMQDMHLGFRFAPVSEKPLNRARHNPSRPEIDTTWVVDLALKIPVGEHFYASDTANRGAANGALGYTIGSAWARQMDVGRPYMSFRYDKNRPFDAYANTTSPVEVDPPDEIKVIAGAELIPYTDGATGGQFTVDLGMGYHLRTQGVWGSGSILPSVLVGEDMASGSETVILDAQSGIIGQMGLNFTAMNHLRIHFGGSLAYYLPSRVEHNYLVRYGRSVGIGYQFAIAGMF